MFVRSLSLPYMHACERLFLKCSDEDRNALERFDGGQWKTPPLECFSHSAGTMTLWRLPCHHSSTMSDNDEPEIEEITLKDEGEEELLTTSSSARLRRNRARADKRRQDRSPQEGGGDSNQEDSLIEQQQQNNSYLARYVICTFSCQGNWHKRSQGELSPIQNKAYSTPINIALVILLALG